MGSHLYFVTKNDAIVAILSALCRCRRRRRNHRLHLVCTRDFPRIYRAPRGKLFKEQKKKKIHFFHRLVNTL